MQVLWAPWRRAYVGAPKVSGCIFCLAADTRERRQRLVLLQRPALVLLNKFPYANGHLMVAPRRHVGDISALPAAEFRTLMTLLRHSMAILAGQFRPQGMNVGINLGSAAGAGFADHLHWHIVPRWHGDTNFMPMLADVRVVPEHLESVYDRLHPAFAALGATPKRPVSTRPTSPMRKRKPRK